MKNIKGKKEFMIPLLMLYILELRHPKVRLYNYKHECLFLNLFLLLPFTKGSDFPRRSIFLSFSAAITLTRNADIISKFIWDFSMLIKSPIMRICISFGQPINRFAYLQRCLIWLSILIEETLTKKKKWPFKNIANSRNTSDRCSGQVKMKIKRYE